MALPAWHLCEGDRTGQLFDRAPPSLAAYEETQTYSASPAHVGTGLAEGGTHPPGTDKAH